MRLIHVPSSLAHILSTLSLDQLQAVMGRKEWLDWLTHGHADMAPFHSLVSVCVLQSTSSTLGEQVSPGFEKGNVV